MNCVGSFAKLDRKIRSIEYILVPILKSIKAVKHTIKWRITANFINVRVELIKLSLLI